MTRSEIREAIKKVFFEEIESDPLTKKMSYKSKIGSKKYKSLNGKQNFRSRHEALTYNIFGNEEVLDQIESEAYRFKKTCRKIPDFVWESKKIIIEIAGMDDIIKPGYWKKLLEAKPCFEKQGYTVYIIDTRIGSLYYNYIRFYEHLCDLLGFTPKSEIKNDIFSYIGDPIDLIKRNQEIVQYKNNNPKAGHKEISNIFNTTPAIVFKILKQAGLTISQPQTQSQIQTRNQEIIQYKKDNPNATAKEIAAKFNVSIDTIYLLFKLKKSNPTNEQSLNNKTMTLKELREIIKKAMQESTIDVPGDPNKLTPQQKSAEISKARQKTRKPRLGTSDDPVDFI